MKILIVNWVFNWGSTGYIARDLKNELECLGHRVLLAVGKKYGSDNVMVFCKPSEQKFYWRLHRMGLSRFSGSIKATKRLICYIEQEKPDIVNLHLLHCNYINLYYLLKWLGKHNVKTIITNHAELYFTGSCGYAYDCMNWQTNQCRNCPNKRYATGAYIGGNTHRNWISMYRAISNFNKENLAFTAVSPWTRDRVLLSPITNRYECYVTLNGLDINTFYKRDDASNVRDCLGNDSYIVWVTANFNPQNKNDVKGGWYLLELAKLLPKQKIVVVANSSSYTDNLPENIFLWGKAKDQNELAQLYSEARLTVLVSRRETFSMVTAESLCCGTPVAGFKAGGPETIAIPDYSRFVDQADTHALAQTIEEMLSIDYNHHQISDRARDIYSSRTMALQYLDAYNKLLNQ